MNKRFFNTMSKAVPAPGFVLTTDQSSLYQVGIRLVFASGTITVDWGDGEDPENFTTGVELTHDYSSTDTYVITLTGDLTNITQFWADDCQFTNATLITGLLTSLRLQNNDLTFVDLTLAPVSQTFWLFGNSSLSSLTFAPSGNGIIDNTLLNGCDFDSLDFSNVGVGGSIQATNMGITSLTFAASGNGALTIFYFNGNSLPGVDFSVFPTSNNVAIRLQSNGFTATEHDDLIIDLANEGWTGGTLTSVSGNDTRTSASDAAVVILEADSWTLN